ncbi:MAG: hypothetical protein EOO52_09755 [Gammaproteobacteria bacterium]|nr:MAG: hypothetical protein EOO52_09755 [Gammaproteobacteria bacterium]
MSIGLIIALIVAVALVLGPVMMMRPNPAQKRKELMRLAARAEGVQYSVRNLPRQADEAEKPDPIAVYFLPPTEAGSSQSWMLLRTRYQHDIHFLGWWAWRDGNRPTDAEENVLRGYLVNLPESVKAVSAGTEGIGVYWDETGGEPVLNEILQLLKSLKEASSR